MVKHTFSRFVLILLLISMLSPLLLNGCAKQGFEIPEGSKLQREATYDDIVLCGPETLDYRQNCPPEQKIPVNRVREIGVTLSDSIFSPHVIYRDYIETKAGQIRYNIIHMEFTDKMPIALMGAVTFWTRRFFKFDIINFDVKQATTLADIQVKRVGGEIFLSAAIEHEDLLIDISPRVKIGDYKLDFIVLMDGIYCGTIPCTIHVIE
ncbi:MAG: hypothetical protein ACYDHZ_08650 [Dehalococcoidia bacterium]